MCRHRLSTPPASDQVLQSCRDKNPLPKKKKGKKIRKNPLLRNRRSRERRLSSSSAAKLCCAVTKKMVVGQTSDLVMAVYCRGGGLSSDETGSWRPCIVSDLADVGVLFCAVAAFARPRIDCQMVVDVVQTAGNWNRGWTSTSLLAAQ